MEEAKLQTESGERLAYSVKETAEVLGISEVTVYRLLLRGRLKSIPGLRHKIIPRSSIVKLLGTAK